MIKGLIGYTGFVGSNLSLEDYTCMYNSNNIYEIIGKSFDLLTCSGIRAEKFLANMYPEQDLDAINNLIKMLKQIKCKKFVLISTIDIYKNPVDVNEDTIVNTEGLHAYGANRYYMEQFVEDYFEDYLIVRLPALFGKGLKKNFIYDLIHRLPSMIMDSKFKELLSQIKKEDKEVLINSYSQDEKNNWHLESNIDNIQRERLKALLEDLQFTSLAFTDYRSKFPFYDLSNLSKDINIALNANINKLNLAVEPVSAQEVARECFGIEFANEISQKQPVYYDMKSKYAAQFGGHNGYMYTKEQTLNAIRRFVQPY